MASAVAPSAAPVCRVTQLNVDYVSERGDTVHAVMDFSLTVHGSEFIGLVGETGSGKSTAGLATLGLTRWGGVIRSGNVELLGQDILSLDPRKLRALRRTHLGLVMQNPRAALNPLVTVGDQIALVYRAGRGRGGSLAEGRTAAVDAMRDVGISDPLRRSRAYPHELSGGMAQRVMIAIATVNRPTLLVADEPTTGLDVTVQADILDVLRERVADTSTAVLMITHDLGVLAHYCDRAGVMYEGRLVETGRVDRLLSDPQHDYTRSLLASTTWDPHDRETHDRQASG